MLDNYVAKAELDRRGIDPARLDPEDRHDRLLLILCGDYANHRHEERRAHVALKGMVEDIPDAETEEPRDDEPAAWLAATVLVAASAAVQRFDRARTNRQSTGRRLAELVEEWKRRHPGDAGSDTGAGVAPA